MADNRHSVILTHEHTDFDALASLLGAALLFPDLLPVLPYQLNRNVQEFLTLYRNQFPFVHPKELPRGRVEEVLLVDTRSANLPKGIQDETRFRAIDHHSVDATVPDGWQLWTEAVGANTTLLVEKLMERQQELTPVEATLLALGVHEDTGSLTYANTTHRDVRALAWLMQPEHKVNLEVLSQFLQHPLSAEQRSLLQTLIDGSTFVEVVGHTALIASANAPTYTGELSSLAHRLRNFHECDALFMVVQLEDIIQIVARSTTDAIDVGAIARALGGGGHTRAAAASFDDLTLAETQERLTELLQQHSQATVTVRQIMSLGRPQTIAPDQSIDEAALLMRRYGHEGFPVVAVEPAAASDNAGDKPGTETLLGVITRREADRAINHDLGNAPVRRFMQAGQVTVSPADSVQQLRRIMIESGWGQVPVVDEAQQIIGIVTRTDLIKLWDEQDTSQQASALDARLRTSLTTAQYALLRLIGAAVEEMDFAVYVVGGFVRDLMLNSTGMVGKRMQVAALDMDIVIEGDAIAFATEIQKRFGGRVVAHRRFGTAKWLLHDLEEPVDRAELLKALQQQLAQAEAPSPNATTEAGARAPLAAALSTLPEHLDFVTARTEFYTAPTVLPTVESSSIKLDLHRRDFTINTLALALTPERWGELLDFYGGVHDLEAGIVRVLHSLSFIDDPTRILRAVRYEQRFDFRIGTRTAELLQDALELLDRVTAARIRHELDRILEEEQPEKVLWRLTELGVLRQLHPELAMEERIAQHFAALRDCLAAPTAPPALHDESRSRLYWALLVHSRSRTTHAALTERLGLRGETQRLMAALACIHENRTTLAAATTQPATVVALLEKSNETALALYIALDLDPSITPVLRRYLTEWRHVRPTIDGRDLQELDIPRGPIYGKILAAVRAALLAGEIVGRAAEIELAKTIAEQSSPAAK